MYATVQLLNAPGLATVEAGGLFSVVFAAAVLAARAATVQAALLGALIAFCCALMPGGFHSALWPLAGMLVLTLGASRIGKARKQMQGTAEKHGRTAAQVAANLGAAALAGSLIDSQGMLLAQIAFTAALGEATADTLASEIGQLSSRPPRLLLTWRPAPAGTDGAITAMGTFAGVCGATAIALVCRWCFHLSWAHAAVGASGAVFGLFFDSLLGQLLERRGMLNNDAVNFFSTLAAAVLALIVGRQIGG